MRNARGFVDQGALDRLIPLVERELRRLADRYMVRWRGVPLQTTALGNEGYLRLINAREVEWKDRVHFLSISANLMRRIVVESARARSSKKRGGGGHKVEFDEALDASLGCYLPRLPTSQWDSRVGGRDPVPDRKTTLAALRPDLRHKPGTRNPAP